MTGQLDEPALEAVLARLPAQIKRIDRDAMTAQTGSRIKRHEAERLGLRRVDDFPHIDAEVVAHQRQLVDEPNVDGPKGVLE